MPVRQRKLSDRQRRACEEVYRDIAGEDFMPAHLAHKDPVREKLDKRLYAEVLGFSRSDLEGIAVVRAKWYEEPTVHGGKGRGARL